MESISINDLLWIQWKNHLISITYKGLPKGVHYTIAFNKNSQYVNLHLTKNAKRNLTEKKPPKIEICRIKKNDFFEIAPRISIILLSHVLEEVQEPKKYKDYYFISFEEVEKEAIQKEIEKELFDKFRDITKLKQNKRLKIKGEIGRRLEQFAENENIQKMFLNKFVVFKQNIKPKGGILISEDEIISLLKIQNKWFKFNSEIDLNLVLTEIFGQRLFNLIKMYIADSLKIIEQAKDIDDCKNYNNSIILEIRKPAANNV